MELLGVWIVQTDTQYPQSLDGGSDFFFLSWKS